MNKFALIVFLMFSALLPTTLLAEISVPTLIEQFEEGKIDKDALELQYKIAERIKNAPLHLKKLKSYISGSVVLKGGMSFIEDGETIIHDLTFNIRNGFSFFGLRKTSYMKLVKTIYKNGVPESLVYRCPIDVQATPVGLAITIYSPSSKDTRDFTKPELRTTKMAHIHVPHESLYNKKGKIDFVLPELMNWSDKGDTRARPDSFYENGFFWAQKDGLFANTSDLRVSDKSISRAKEFVVYAAPKVRTAVGSASSYAIQSALYGAQTAYSLLKTPTAYDLAMALAHLTVAGVEISTALSALPVVGPVALLQLQPALSAVENSFVHLQKVRGVKEEQLAAQVAYINSMKELVSVGNGTVEHIIKTGVGIYNLKLDSIKELAKALSLMKQACEMYSSVAPAA